MPVQAKYNGLTVTDYTFSCTTEQGGKKEYKIDIEFDSQRELLQAAAKQVAVRIGQRIRVWAAGKGKGEPYIFPPRREDEPSVKVDVNGSFKRSLADEMADDPEKFRRDTIERLRAIARKNGQELTPEMIAMLTGTVVPPPAPQPQTIPPAANPTPPHAPKNNGGNNKNRNQRNVAV